jgi:hypothetical protein
MALAMEERSAWDEAVTEIREEIGQMSEPVRSATFDELDTWLKYPPEGWKDCTKDELITRVMAELSCDVETMLEMGTAATLKEAARQIYSLAIEVRALKAIIEEQGLLIAGLNNMLRGFGATLVVGLPEPSGEQGRQLYARALMKVKP